MRARVRVSMGSRAGRGAGARAFTIIEILTAVLIVGVLIGLLLVGLRAAGLTGQRTQQVATVSALKQGVTHFRDTFGFLPPLVRDMDPVGGSARSTVRDAATGRWRISVRTGSDADVRFLSHDTGTFTVPANNPYYDPRYSVRTLPYYLAGALDQPLTDNRPEPPIDGVKGPGMYPPNADGTFELPESMLSGSGIARNRTGTTHQPFVDTGRSDPKVVVGAEAGGTIPADASDDPAARVRLLDRKGVAYRYYLWTTRRDPNTGDLINPVPEIIRKWYDRPGRTAEEANPPQLQNARYAIVGAGPDGVFGDEDRAVLAAKLGMADDLTDPAATKLRRKAIDDNVVEVGQ